MKIAGGLAELLECWTFNSVVSSLSSALNPSPARAQILGHSCNIGNWFSSYHLGFLTMTCSIYIVCFIIPEKPHKGRG